MSNIFIISQPRSGSSMLANLINSSGYKNFVSKNSVLLAGSSQNKAGYFEDVKTILLNDSIIRALYGNEYSFLYPPPTFKRLYNSANYLSGISNNFFYDINEETLYFPEGFKDNPSEYTGHDWDIWGLTRMIKGQKWYQCYSKFGVADKIGIKETKTEIENTINTSNKLVIKDPRFALTLEIFNFFSNENNKFIFLSRSCSEVIASMQSHYGSKIFQSLYLPNSRYVSNHFNHMVGYMDYQKFFDRYEFIKSLIVSNQKIDIKYENILSKNKNEIKKLEDFLEVNLDLSSIIIK